MQLRLLALALPALALAAPLGSASAAVTEADFLVRTTGNLVNLCAATPDDQLMTAAVNFCHGFAIGVYRTLSAEQPAMPLKLFCTPNPPPTRNQAIADFVAWARASPSVLSEPPADGVLRYLSQRYPCAAPR
jgi:Ssp1 endopeptidase immunity protein Rap1a